MMGIIDSSQLAFLSLSHSVQQSGQSLSQRVSHTYTVVGRQVGICSTAVPAHRGWTTKSYSRVELVGEFSIMHVRQWCSRQKLERATQHPSIVLYRAVGAWRDQGAHAPPQFLAAPLTLPHPGGDYNHNITICPQIFRHSYGPALLQHAGHNGSQNHGVRRDKAKQKVTTTTYILRFLYRIPFMHLVFLGFGSLLDEVCIS